MGVRLRPLRDDELPAFIEHGRASYTRDMVAQAGLTPEQAEQKAESDWARLLPNGEVPAGHHLFAVEAPLQRARPPKALGQNDPVPHGTLDNFVGWSLRRMAWRECWDASVLPRP